MARIRVSLLGHPLIERDGAAIQVDTRKAIALLAYLVTENRPQSRDTLAALLWSEYDDRRARAALRRTLSTLRAAIGDDALVADRRTAQVRSERLDLDVHRLREAMDRARRHGHAVREACAACLPALNEALAVARGDFLEGFAVRDAPEFDDWQLNQAQAVRQEL